MLTRCHGFSRGLGCEDMHGHVLVPVTWDFHACMGSSAEPIKVVVVDQKFEEQKPEDEPGAV